MFGIDDFIVGSVISGGMSLLGGERANSAREVNSQAQMDFQREMSNTSYQRAVKDIQASGLNPMLAYSQGGASTPAGSQPAIEDTLTPAISSARDVFRASTEAGVRREQVNNLAADTGLKSASTDKAAAEAEQSRSQAALNLAMIDKARQDIVTSAASADLMGKQGQSVMANLEKIAPEIRHLVSQADLNDASRRKLIAELPLIAADVRRTKAETNESYERRLLLSVESRLASLKTNEAQAHSDMYGSDYGASLPYVSSGAKAAGDIAGSLSPWAWLLKGGKSKNPVRYGGVK